MEIQDPTNLRPQPQNTQKQVQPPKSKKTPPPSPVKQNAGKVSIKYELFKFHTSYIKNIALNRNNILAFSSGNYGENIKFVQITQNNLSLEVDQLQLHRSISLRHNIMQWSPDAKYLAIGGAQLSIWQWEQDQIKMLKQYSDDFYQIYAFAWSPNSQRFAVSSINHALSLVIRDVSQEAKIKQIKNSSSSTILSLQWDPFDKHLACLLSNNIIQIYSCSSWDRIHTVGISMQVKRGIVPKNQPLKIDWSPDFRYLVVPAIDDKPVPYVVALDRNKAFGFKGIFMGPFSTINCVKFNPHLYELPSTDIVSVFAMGDSEGNITLWLIGEKYVSKKPLMFFRAREDTNEIIQKMQWSTDGRVLYATTFKRYLITIVFEYEVFGRKLEEGQKQKVLEGLYGSSRSLSSQFRIFRMGDAKPKMVEEKPAEAKPVQTKKSEYVYTAQKVITEGNKMKIVPSMLVKASQKDAIETKIQSTATVNIVPKPIQPVNKTQPPPQTTAATVPQVLPSPPVHRLVIEHPLVLSTLNSPQSSYRISASRHIQIVPKTAQSIMNIYHQASPQYRQVLSTIPVPGKINFVECESQMILVYTNEGYIYLFSETGNALQLPMQVGQIHMIKLKQMDILTLSTNCYLRLFNLPKKKLYVNINILDLLGSNITPQPGTKVVSKAIQYMEIGQNSQVSLQLVNKKKFFLNQSTLTWHVMPNQIYTPIRFQEHVKPKYPEISQTLAKFSQSFFQTMIKPPSLATVQQLQYNLIYFRKHSPNKQKYMVSLLAYIKQLDKLRMNSKLREVVISHFVEPSSDCYLPTPSQQLMGSIRALDNQTINELIDMNLLH